jgi:hypothetical protein
MNRILLIIFGVILLISITFVFVNVTSLFSGYTVEKLLGGVFSFIIAGFSIAGIIISTKHGDNSL